MTNFAKSYQTVARRIPFAGYMPPLDDAHSYRAIAETVLEFLPDGSRVLDFGCGPCDKTAVLSDLGYECAGFDDLGDAWHRQGDNLEQIKSFAADSGVELAVADEHDGIPFDKGSFDMVMAHDILEHLHNSPREFLVPLLDLVRPGGLLFISVPNAVNLRKRLAVLRGRSNHAPFGDYYWYPGDWRGHVREYVKDDLDQLAENLGLETLEVTGCDHMLQVVPGGRAGRAVWELVTDRLDGLKDTVRLVARKPEGWTEGAAPAGLVEGFQEARHD